MVVWKDSVTGVDYLFENTMQNSPAQVLQSFAGRFASFVNAQNGEGVASLLRITQQLECRRHVESGSYMQGRGA